jgi:hypothetical protein
MVIHELKNPIEVHTPLGKGKAIAWLDYGTEVNTVWKVVFHEDGKVRNVYDTDIRVYPNAMNGIGVSNINIPTIWKNSYK